MNQKENPKKIDLKNLKVTLYNICTYMICDFQYYIVFDFMKKFRAAYVFQHKRNLM